MNVLITSVGSNTSIGILKELSAHRKEFGIKLFGSDLNAYKSCAGVRWLDKFFQTPSVYNKTEYVDNIVTLIQQYNIQCVIPVHDKEIEVVSLLSMQHPSITFWAVNDPQIIDICNDKEVANALAKSVDINVPAYTSDINDAARLSFPIIAKPADGVSSIGMSIFNNVEMLRTWDNQSKRKYVFQEMITDAMEYTVDCYSDREGQFYGAVARSRMEIKAGISTKGVTAFKPELVEYCRLLLNKMKYKGASNLQFMEKKGRYYFIEINPRFSGAGILSYKAGLNSPLYTILEAMNKPLPSTPSFSYGLCMARYWEETFFNAEGNLI